MLLSAAAELVFVAPHRRRDPDQQTSTPALSPSTSPILANGASNALVVAAPAPSR